MLAGNVSPRRDYCDARDVARACVTPIRCDRHTQSQHNGPSCGSLSGHEALEKMSRATGSSVAQLEICPVALLPNETAEIVVSNAAARDGIRSEPRHFIVESRAEVVAEMGVK